MQNVILQKLSRGEKILLRQAVIDHLLELAERRAEGEMLGRMRHGPNPHLENLVVAAYIRRRHLQHARAGELLDVGVIAVIQAPLLAQHLIQMTARIAMLAEPGVRHRQGVPIFLATMGADGETDADGRRFAFFFDDFDVDALDRLGRYGKPINYQVRWQFGQLCAQCFDNFGRGSHRRCRITRFSRQKANW